MSIDTALDVLVVAPFVIMLWVATIAVVYKIVKSMFNND